MAPNLVASGEELLLTWIEPTVGAAGARAHRLRFTRLAGDRWSPPVTIAQGADLFANWADFPALAVRPGGRLLAHWLAKTGPGTYAYGIHLARSTDRGVTWTPAGLLHEDGTPTEHGFVSFEPEETGVRAFWLDGRETGHGGAMTLRTALVAAAAGPGALLDDRVCDCCQTGAAMTSAGPVVAYRDRSPDEVRDIAIVRRAGARWTAPTLVHRDGWKIPGCPVNGPAVAAAGRRVAVAWFTGAAPGPRVQVAFSDDAGASFGAPVLIDGERPLGRVDLALDDRGSAIVAWLALEKGERGRRGQAVVRLRRAAPGGASAAITLAATSSARSSGFPRLVRSGDRLYLAWLEDGEPTRLRASVLPLAALPGA